MVDKYGDPDADMTRPEEGYAWRASEDSQCGQLAESRASPALSAIWTEGGTAIQDIIVGDRPMPGIPLPDQYRNPLDSRYEDVPECGPYLRARWFFALSRGRQDAGNAYKPGAVDWIDQTLTDPAQYIQAYKQNHEAARRQISTGASSSGNAGAAAIKF